MILVHLWIFITFGFVAICFYVRSGDDDHGEEAEYGILRGEYDSEVFMKQ